ncbi:MAG: 2-oxo acid dehydrogenase subunit E2 [Bacillota bacterium]
MATKIEMPKLGLSMQEGKVVEWKFSEGDEINKGEPIVEISTDKISNVVESPVDGVLLEIYVKEGEVVPVHTPIGVVGQEDESIDSSAKSAKEAEENDRQPEKKEDKGKSPKKVAKKTVSDQDDTGEVSPVAAEYADRAGIDPSTLSGSGPKGRVIKSDVMSYLKQKQISLPEEKDYGNEMVSPVADKLAQKAGFDPGKLKGSGPKGRVLKKDVEKYIKENNITIKEELKSNKKEIDSDKEKIDSKKRVEIPDDLSISPVAEKICVEAGIYPAGIAGTGPDGRVMKSDVERCLAESRTESRTESGETGSSQVIKVAKSGKEEASERRKLIAEQMKKSVRETAQADVSIDVEVTRFMELYQSINKELAGKLNLNAVFAKALAEIMADFPEINATYDKGQIEYHREVNTGIAVDSKEGLIVPVIKDVGNKNLTEISEEISSLAKKAKKGNLSPDDMQGGTITISNLGMYNIRSLTPIINYPEAAILGVGTIKDTPVVKNGGIFPGKEMNLTLTFDHRLVDGGPAGKFLNSLKQLLEEPENILLK